MKLLLDGDKRKKVLSTSIGNALDDDEVGRERSREGEKKQRWCQTTTYCTMVSVASLSANPTSRKRYLQPR